MRNFVLALGLFAGATAFAQEDLNLRVQKLETMMEQLRAEKPREPQVRILRDTEQLRTQLGPAASKIYFQTDADWTLGLSSELFTYQNGDVARANVLSVSPVIAFRPHRRLIFNSQLSFENGGSESRNTVAYQKGQSVVTMAYLDWLLSPEGEAGLRVGHQLVPIGWMNTRAEPVTNLSVLRPELERELIPGSWHENGASLWVDRPRADIQIGVFNSLEGRNFRGPTFLAGGRNQGQNAKANDVMGVLRVNAKNEWFLLGASMAAGNTAQNDPALRNAGFRLAEAHGRLRFARLEFLGQGVLAQVDDAEAISIATGTPMASNALGNSFQGAFNILGGARELWVFLRYSRYDLNARMPVGYNPDPALNKQVTTFGASYFPTPNVVIKSDYAIKNNAAAVRENEMSLGVGVVF